MAKDQLQGRNECGHFLRHRCRELREGSAYGHAVLRCRDSRRNRKEIEFTLQAACARPLTWVLGLRVSLNTGEDGAIVRDRRRRIEEAWQS